MECGVVDGDGGKIRELWPIGDTELSYIQD